MTIRADLHGIRARAGGYLRTVSAVALTAGLAVPAHAQLAQLRGAAPATLTAPTINTVPVRGVSARDALARQADHQAQAAQIRAAVLAARNAVVRANPTDGISTNGLNPIAAVRQAIALSQAGNASAASAALAAASAANDPTGAATWEGAGLPTQTVSNGQTTVSITQTQNNALLSWDRFDVGANTTLNFVQQAGGKDQAGWTVVNRVVNSTDPTTILGKINAPGSVFILNRFGVIFGATSQVNLRSLVASTLELGAYRSASFPVGSRRAYNALTLKQRNNTYLQNGAFALSSFDNTLTPSALLLSPLFAPGTYGPDDTPNDAAFRYAPPTEGSVIVDAGASITATTGGAIILAGPRVENSGALSAVNGQVSLQGGRFISAVASTGAADSADPYVRGYILGSVGRNDPTQNTPLTPDDGVVINNGLIDSRRGYASLGAGQLGSVTNNGLISATTSVSRNGKISLNAGYVTIGGNSDPTRAGALVITPDVDGEQIPQGTAANPPSFKSSQIEIGYRGTLDGKTLTALTPGVVTFGANSLVYAPNADVTVGRAAGTVVDPTQSKDFLNPSSITIEAGATIDVSGVKDVKLDASRNSLQITPVTRNELRDTPNYREVTLDGSFTLNATTLYVDPRKSGVRADGVAWIGSPLIEAGSLASQILVTAPELMTKGGTVTLAVNPINGPTATNAAPQINIAKGATIDISGGWVNYAAGFVRTSQLITSDGRSVDISQADPNDSFVAVANGYTQNQPRFGVASTYANSTVQGGHYESSYDEGRDAGALTITAPLTRFGATIYGQAFTGANQAADARLATKASSIVADPRKLQASAQELPSGGFVRIGSLIGTSVVAGGGDIVVYSGTPGSAAATAGVTLIDSAAFSSAGLSALTLQTTGAVTFAGASQASSGQTADVVAISGASNLTLAAGGILTVDAGRSINFNGTVTAPAGGIYARTISMSGDGLGYGSAFTTADDYTNLDPNGPLPRPLDINVTGTLSVAGQWVNDYLAGNNAIVGGAYRNGGTISLSVAPKVFQLLGANGVAQDAIDLSGSIDIATSARLNLSAGGYVSPGGALSLDGKGGNLALINQTTYASTVGTQYGPRPGDTLGLPGGSVYGSNQSVSFTPGPSDVGLQVVVPSVVPSVQRSFVRFDAGSIDAFGFSSGGTFTLFAPDISFGSDNHAGAAHIGLDFVATTGFGALNLTTLRSRVVGPVFNNGRSGASAFFETTTFAVNAGETLNLSQTLLPQFLDRSTQQSLIGLATGADITSILAPSVPTNLFDQRAVDLTLGGLIELDVKRGGAIIGAPGAVLTIPRLLNDGSIVLRGGSIVQKDSLPQVLAIRGVYIQDVATGGQGLAGVFGTADSNGLFDENAPNALGILFPGTNRVATNRELLTNRNLDARIIFAGALSGNEGVRLTAGSVTDLSGIAIFDPRAPLVRGGSQARLGRLLAGGTLSTAAAYQPTSGNAYFSASGFDAANATKDTGEELVRPIIGAVAARSLSINSGAAVNLAGSAATFDVLTTAGLYVAENDWSNGGTLSVMGAGGSIASGTINAAGGAAQALGGTLNWLRPTISGNGLGGSISSQLVSGAGFSTLNAFGGATFDGNVSLSLSKAFLVSAAPSLVGAPFDASRAIVLSATPGTNATVTAPYISITSVLGTAPNLVGGAPQSSSLTLRSNSNLDIFGAVYFDRGLGNVTLSAANDLRLTGVFDQTGGAAEARSHYLNGEVIANGNLRFDAQRTYATTGTGNLQGILENNASPDARPFGLYAMGNSSITFTGTNRSGATPLSAGSYIEVRASTISQQGYLAAPMGRIDLGANTAGAFFTNPTQSVTLAAGSVTTISGAGLVVPYGTTTDLTDYFFLPSSNLPIDRLPSGDLRLSAASITVQGATNGLAGASVDGTGGGTLFGYEFVSGVGGSRDVLNQLNGDQFSSNDYNAATGLGYQFPDHRQVYALIPADQASTIAGIDPVYSTGYGDLYGANAGLSVTLDGSTGIPAGTYLLLPAHYALLPGVTAYRIYENVGTAPLPAGTSQTLLDGSVIVGGNYATAGTGFADSQRRSFTIQSFATFSKYSQLKTTDASTTVINKAQSAGTVPASLTLDAARVVLAPLQSLTIDSQFKTSPATGGRGSRFDLLGDDIVIAAAGSLPAPSTSLVITDAALNNLGANSLSVGALRTDNSDGTTTLNITASKISVLSGATLSLPELLLSVGAKDALANENPTIDIADGVTIRAAGTLQDTRTTNYVVQSDANASATSPYALTGIGAVVRVANGTERLVTRTGDFATKNTLRPATLRVGAATISGQSIALDSSRNLNFNDPTATINGQFVSLGGDAINFGGPFFRGATLASLESSSRLTLTSRSLIGFSDGNYTFNDLVINAPGVRRSVFGATAQRRGDVTINAGAVTLNNTQGVDLGGCTGAALLACGAFGSQFTLNATQLTFGTGKFATYNFDGGITLGATNGTYYTAVGSVDTGAANLTLVTPFIADLATQADPRAQTVRPDLSLLTTGNLVVRSPGGAVAPTGNRAPNARIQLGTVAAPVASATIDGAALIATSGIVSVQATGDIAVLGNALLSAPGFTKSFGDAIDTVTVSASAGNISLGSKSGNIAIANSATIVTDNGIGNAGGLSLVASNGSVDFGFNLNNGVTGTRGGSLIFDSGKSAFDLAGFIAGKGSLFTGDIDIRSNLGNLTLNAGQVIRASSVTLTADGGSIAIAGTIDTSGVSVAGLTGAAARDARVNGGDIQLFGRNGVTLASTALLDTHTSGYAADDTRQASAGNVTIGIEDKGGAIIIASGARIDVGARNTQAALAAGQPANRLVAVGTKDPVTLSDITVYKLISADQGGVVSFRAPVIGANEDTVDVRLAGTISGASSLQVEGFKRYDLDALAANPAYAGLFDYGDHIALDATYSGNNFLIDDFVGPDGTRSVVNFIRNFSLKTVDGSSLDGFRLRPGIELATTKTLTFQSNWNLGAGIVDQDAAAKAGVLIEIPQLGAHNDDGTPYYAVAAGQEANLIENYTNFIYRVGGKASGEAPIVTLRARKTLDIGYSITDGFFVFRDRSDPNYLNYQLGGGDRTYNPALTVGCGLVTANDCSSNVLASYDDILSGAAAGSNANRVNISLTNYALGDDLVPGVLAPFSASANSAAALPGTDINGTQQGDAVGVAELFPLINNGTQAVHSSSLRLVGGADATLSANPLHVDAATNADVKVEGQGSYTVQATRGFASIAGDNLQLRLRGTDDQGRPVAGAAVNIGDFLSGPAAEQSLDPNTYTVLTWGAGQGTQQATTRARALAFFRSRYPNAQFQGGKSDSTYSSVAAPLSAILDFLASYGSEYATKIANGTFSVTGGAAQPPLGSLGIDHTVYYNNVVRTGAGSIDVASARDVDLRQSLDVQYRTVSLTDGTRVRAQIGGSAIYTAGTLVPRTAIVATDGKITASYSLTGDGLTSFNGTDYIPSSRRQYLATPQYTDNGGAVTVTAVRDVLGRRDIAGELTIGTVSSLTNLSANNPIFANGQSTSTSGFGDYTGYVTSVGQAAGLAVTPQTFDTGIASFGGGDVSVKAGHDIVDLQVTLASSSVTANARTSAPQIAVGTNLTTGNAAASTLISFGSGVATLNAGNDLVGGTLAVSDGSGLVKVGGSIVSGPNPGLPGPNATPIANDFRILDGNARISVNVGGSATIGAIRAFGQPNGQLTNYSALSAVSVLASGDITVSNSDPNDQLNSSIGGAQFFSAILPGSLSLVSLTGDVSLAPIKRGSGTANILAPSAEGTLTLIAGGSISNLAIVMSDRDPALFGGAFAVPTAPPITADGILANTTDAERRAAHSDRILHAGDNDASRIFANGSITSSTFLMAEQTRIRAGVDIVDVYFSGQNVNQGEVTRISAGRDITATVGSTLDGRIINNGNTFILGGYGTLAVEAGRNLGPFASSGTITGGLQYAGGILTVGNDNNPWLDPTGAKIFTLFGVANGVNVDGFQSTYLDPANSSKLDGDLFVQQSDPFGNKSPDRTRPIYAPILARWLRDNAPDAFAAVFGSTSFASDDALATAAYGRFADLYSAFAKLDGLTRRDFLINQVYFNELSQTADPTGPSYLQYVRGYRAANTLFPPSLGYTDNLAPYTTDPATISADHPLGDPVRNIVNGQPEVAKRVITGSADLRLATINTARGGDITILGPGGDFIAGSVVRLDQQIANRATALGVNGYLESGGVRPVLAQGAGAPGNSINVQPFPIGYEGILTLRGGAIRSFTDGDLRLNQSRMFTQSGGDITAWSSNGDLNAGQGPKSASNFPPVAVRFDTSGLAEVNTAGSVSGAGIGTFLRNPTDTPSDVILIAPVGLVDAGDAGVRASGSIFVAAARVANAANFQASGSISGVPQGTVAAAPSVPANVASSIVANVARIDQGNNLADRRSQITVDVSGFTGNDACADPDRANDPQCRVPQ